MKHHFYFLTNNKSKQAPG